MDSDYYKCEVSDDKAFEEFLENYMKVTKILDSEETYHEYRSLYQALADGSPWPQHPEYWLGIEKTTELYKDYLQNVEK